MMAIDGWTEKSLGKVAEITMGQSPDSKFYSEEEIGMPFLQGCAEFSSKYPVIKQYCSQPKKVAREGSILFSVRAPVGRTNIADRDYIIGRGLAAITGIEVAQSYLEHFLSYNEAGFRNASQGSTFEAINSAELNNWEIAFPTSSEEQTQIAAILSTIDKAIEQIEAIIAKQQRIKTGLMQDLLTRGIDEQGNIRSEATHAFKDSPLGRIPVEWEIFIVSQVGEVTMGRQLAPKYKHGKNPMPYLRVANVFDGWIDYSDVLQMDFSKEEQKRFLLCAGDILLNEGQSLELVGRSAIYQGPEKTYCFQNTLIRFRTYDHALPEFCRAIFKWWLDTGKFQDVAKQTTSVAHLGADRFANMKFPLPPLDEQMRIAKTIGQLEKLIQFEQNSLNKLRQTKTGLMQDLLTGKVRVTALLKASPALAEGS